MPNSFRSALRAQAAAAVTGIERIPGAGIKKSGTAKDIDPPSLSEAEDRFIP